MVGRLGATTARTREEVQAYAFESDMMMRRSEHTRALVRGALHVRRGGETAVFLAMCLAVVAATVAVGA